MITKSDSGKIYSGQPSGNTLHTNTIIFHQTHSKNLAIRVSNKTSKVTS